VAALQRAVAIAEVDALPWPSASTWISTWRGFSRNFSMYTVPSAEGGLRFRLRVTNMELSSAASLCTTRMPRPPPPAAALMMTG
jgi:hypothetical protein